MSVRVERNGAVWTVVIDRPASRNAIDREHAEALVAAFREVERDAEARAAVLFGEGPAFCAGADLKHFDNHVAPDGDGPMGPSRIFLEKPVIAAIEGPAVAGGLELALWCDLRVMAEDAIVGVFCRRWGVPLIDGGTVRLPRLIGLSRALDLVLTGRPVSAAEALQMGLANRVVPHGQARAAAEALAREIAAFPQACMLRDRRSAYEQVDLSLADAMRNEFALGLESLKHASEGTARFASGAGRHGQF